MEELPIVKSKYPELSHRQVVSKIGAMYKDIKPKKLKQVGKLNILDESHRLDLPSDSVSVSHQNT